MSQGQVVPIDKGVGAGLGWLRSSLDVAKDVVRAENAALYSIIGTGLGATLGTIAVLAGGIALWPFIPLGVLVLTPSGAVYARYRAFNGPDDPEERRRLAFEARVEEISQKNAQRALLNGPQDAAARSVIDMQINELNAMGVRDLCERYWPSNNEAAPTPLRLTVSSATIDRADSQAE